MSYLLLALSALAVIALIAWQWFRPSVLKENDLSYLSVEEEDNSALKDFYWQAQTGNDYQKHSNAPEKTDGDKRVFVLEPVEQEQALYLMRLKDKKIRFFNNEQDLIFSLQMDAQIDAFICSTSAPNAYRLMNQVAALLSQDIPLFFTQYGTQFYIYPQDKARMYLLDKKQTHWAL